MYALERPPHQSSAALDDVRSPRIRALYDYWKSKCNDVVPPPRSAIEPAEIRPLLPYLLLTELTAAPFRISYRLVGTAVVRWHGEDFTGRDHGAVPSLAESGIEESYRQSVATRAPVFGRTALYAGDQSWIGFDYAVFPLSDNGKTVNKCLAIECIGPSEATASDAASVGDDSSERPPAAPADSAESRQPGQHERQGRR
ncbi:PAS domain-containing protein [Dongia sp.]|uniref:PAS domain-containing protein n=1 Tax=Dongia sp. TaxID=1977262 RepID=UPI003750F386